MTGLLPLVLLAALAGVATLLLEHGGRRGYGWVTGAEFALFGIAVGPLGLDLLSRDLLAAARTPVALGASWLGLGLGLRLRPAALSKVPGRHFLASQLEPILVLIVLRGLLALAARAGAVAIPPAAAWALSAVGAATTRSAMDWARAQQGARGPVTEALRTICTFDDLPAVLALAALFAVAPPHPTLLSSPGQRLLATLVLGFGLAALVLLIVARRRFRAELSWLALFGACALGTGLAEDLAVLPLAATCVCGILVARFSRHAEELDEVTRSTQRPVVQVLLLLGGASVRGGMDILAAALAFAALRAVAKLTAGAAIAPIALGRGAGAPALGLTLLGGGGVVFAAAFSSVNSFDPEVGSPLLAGAIAMVVLGDLLGAPALRSFLRHAGELPSAGPAAPSAPAAGPAAPR